MSVGSFSAGLSGLNANAQALSVIASNTRAIAFYEKRGWRPLRKTPHEIAPAPRQEMIKMVG